ncbi:MAG: NAD(+)/NADH kinase, partial [Candidatus Eisenbacteria bacterium]
VGIAANLQKENASTAAGEIISWLERNGATVWLEKELGALLARGGVPLAELPRKCDLIVALGGDGTLLSVVRHACGGKVPLLGVNLGALGFITETTTSEVIPTLERILRDDCLVEERMMLEARVVSDSGEVVSRHVCLNDAVINKSAVSRAVQINMRISGHYVGTFLADGLIVSTPTGSTAYSLSAGGPIVRPTMQALIATPICPHTLAVRPLIFSKDEELEVSMLSSPMDVALTLDGQEWAELAEGQKVLFRRAEESVFLVCSGDRSFYEVLRTKLGWGGMAKR